MKGKKPTVTEISFSPQTIEDVWKEYERANPGKTYADMPREAFVDAMLEKIFASARKIEGGNT